MRLQRIPFSATFTVAALFFATASMPAYAYLDPGTGSMILQVLLGGLAGLALAGRFYWNRLLVIIGVRSESAAPDHADPTDTVASKVRSER